MRKSTFLRLCIKIKRLFFLLIFFHLTTFCFAQAPSWVAGTPSIPNVGVYSLNCNYGINMTGRVYIAVLGNYSTTDFVGSTIRSVVLGGGGGAWVTVSNIPISDVGVVLNSILKVPTPNKLYTIYFAAENSTGTIQSWSTRIYATTKPCPTPIVTQSQYMDGECVGSATAWWELTRFDPPGPVGPSADIDGIFKGTTWHIDWDIAHPGVAVTNYTSAFDGDVPGSDFYSHLYNSASNCVYTAVLTVTNPCGLTLGPLHWTVDVHGREILTEGDGELIIGAKAPYTINPVQIIQVCEGTEHLIQLVDNSTWNCQNPVDYLGNPRPPNDAPRTIQWLYGEDNDGVVWNTISDPVIIDGLHSATLVDGYVGDPVKDILSTGQLSKIITIPSTSIKGQYFDVYLRNWNKCNTYPGNPPVFTHVRILVVERPLAPTPNNEKACVGSTVPDLTVDGAPGVTEFRWYRDAALTDRVPL